MSISRTVWLVLEDIFVSRLALLLHQPNVLPGITVRLGRSTQLEIHPSSVQLGITALMGHHHPYHALLVLSKIFKEMTLAKLALLASTVRLKLLFPSNVRQVTTVQHRLPIAPLTHVPLELTVTERICDPQRSAISVRLGAFALLSGHYTSLAVVRLGTTAVAAQQFQLLRPIRVE
jgi:hypothetical protein